VSVRPETLSFRPGGHGVPVRVLQREFKGHDLTFTCQVLQGDGLRLVVQTGPECAVQVGDTVPLAAAGAAVPLEASTGLRRS
jgi:iron(III) transport system ATP-binding protein